MMIGLGLSLGRVVRRRYPLGLARWAHYWDADTVTVGAAPAVASWSGRVGSTLEPGTAPDVSAFDGRGAVQFVLGSNEYLYSAGPAAVAVGDDTAFTIAWHGVVDSVAASGAIISFGVSTATQPFWNVLIGETGLRIQGRGDGDVGAVTSNADLVPVAAATEYVVTIARTATSCRIGLNGVFTDADHEIGALTGLDRFACGGLLRSSFSAPTSQTCRRVALCSGAISDAEAAQVFQYWYGR